MPLCNKALLFQACKLTFLLIVTPFFFPFLIFWAIFLTVSSIVIIPFLCISISTYFFYLFLRRISIQYLVKVSIHFCAQILDNNPATTRNDQIRNKDYKQDHNSTVTTTNDVDRAVSVEIDPLECPSHEESEEDERVKEDTIRDDGGSNESWQMQIFNAFNPGDDRPFYQTLNFWKKKEGEKT
ncbi:hypothetical protein ACHQM5_006746 [Ranunculus cassubicifolius]